jgi:hypothetical protein
MQDVNVGRPESKWVVRHEAVDVVAEATPENAKGGRHTRDVDALCVDLRRECRKLGL